MPPAGHECGVELPDVNEVGRAEHRDGAVAVDEDQGRCRPAAVGEICGEASAGRDRAPDQRRRTSETRAGRLPRQPPSWTDVKAAR